MKGMPGGWHPRRELHPDPVYSAPVSLRGQRTPYGPREDHNPHDTNKPARRTYHISGCHRIRVVGVASGYPLEAQEVLGEKR